MVEEVFKIIGALLISFVFITITNVALEMGKEKQKDGKNNPNIIKLTIAFGILLIIISYNISSRTERNISKLRNNIIFEVESYSDRISEKNMNNEDIGDYTNTLIDSINTYFDNYGLQ